MKACISPAMLYADLMEMPKILRSFEANGADSLHIDVMDGCFAPSIGLGPHYCASLRKSTKLPLDLHLMVENPLQLLPLFAPKKGDAVSVHPESTRHLHYLLREIRRSGAEARVALSAASPISLIEEVLDDIDGVLVLTAELGYPKPKLLASSVSKVARVRALLDSCGKQHLPIAVKGCIGFANAKLLRAAGADIFVADSETVFKADASIVEGLVKLRTAISGRLD